MESFPMGCNSYSKATGSALSFFFFSNFPTFLLQSTPVESPDLNFVSISAEERDAEVTINVP